MQLEPGQLSTLFEMGIPVWELRPHQATHIDESEEIISNCKPIDEQLLQCDWWVLLDSHTHNEQAHRLLNAMLASISVDFKQVALVSLEQLSQLHQLANSNKLLLAFGEKVVDQLFNGQDILDGNRGKVMKSLPSELTTIVSYDLNDFLTQPEMKALAWQDLQLAKSTYLNLNQAQ